MKCMTLSLCMIVKNESDVLSRALGTAKVYADEIVIVDTGSTDNTKEIAREYTDKVYDFEWCDDFSAARNYAFSQAKGDYNMWLDADDIVPMPTARAIARLKTGMDGADIVMLPYVLNTAGAPEYSFYRERIVRNADAYRFKGRVHEAITLGGRVIKKKLPIYHAKPDKRQGGTSRNLGIYKAMLSAGERFTARDRYYYARELYFNGEYAKAADEFRAFLAMPDGYYVNKTDASLMLSRCLIKCGDRPAAYLALFDSFLYGLPTGEVCCEIALLYYNDGRYALAAYWFERAATLKPDYDSGAFIDADCYGFLPYVWLTVCYDKLHSPRLAYYYHTRAKKLRPDHPAVIANQRYFDSIDF